MQIQDTNQTITKMVKNACKNAAERNEVTYFDITLNSDAILNKVYEYISVMPKGLVQSVQNLLDRSEYSDEHQRFDIEGECRDCVQTIIASIETCLADALNTLDIIGIDTYQSIINDLPDFNWKCFEDARFTCQGETCNRDHSP